MSAPDAALGKNDVRRVRVNSRSVFEETSTFNGTSTMKVDYLWGAVTTLAAFACSGSGSQEPQDKTSFGGATFIEGDISVSGGSVAKTTVNGGAPSIGGATNGGATSVVTSKVASGGNGGSPDSGRSSTSGGVVAIGGKSTSGGVSSIGGRTSSGGTAGGPFATGGTSFTGGASSAGGATSTVLGATPPMGWNSWNTFNCNGLTEALVKAVADKLVSSGMKAVGYQYVNLDDCWMDGRDGNGKVKVNATKFPSGMKALTDYVHGKGLKMGLYSTPGTKTCAAIYGGYTGGVGSLGKETTDAQTYAEWGIDYLKYDKCTAALSGFAVMRDALKATGRPILYSINPGDGTGCVPGKCPLDLPQIANLWRIGFDINASWNSMIGLADQNEPLYSFAGPGHWNDPDMLEVGKLANANEDRAHFSLWAIMAAPLIAGNDIRNMSATTTAILTNAEVIAVDQDPLGIQGHIVSGKGTNLQVWAKKLSGINTSAAVLLNRGTSPASITAQWTTLGIPTGEAKVRDLWSKKDLGSFTGSYTATLVPAHGAVMIKVVSSNM
jgi:alpha-galactosidase